MLPCAPQRQPSQAATFMHGGHCPGRVAGCEAGVPGAGGLAAVCVSVLMEPRAASITGTLMCVKVGERSL